MRFVAKNKKKKDLQSTTQSQSFELPRNMSEARTKDYKTTVKPSDGKCSNDTSSTQSGENKRQTSHQMGCTLTNECKLNRIITKGNKCWYSHDNKNAFITFLL